MIGFSFHYGSYFPVSFLPANFYWLPGIKNFILSIAGFVCVCILINVLELCPGVQKLLENSLVLSDLTFVRGGQSSV